MRTFKYHFILYDDEKNIMEEKDYYTLTDICKEYNKIPYATLYYIARYDDERLKTRKPQKSISNILKRISITRIDNDYLFKKKA